MKTNEEIADILEVEGVDYAVAYYMRADEIQDPVTAELWRKAEAAITDLVEHVQASVGRELDV